MGSPSSQAQRSGKSGRPAVFNATVMRTGRETIEVLTIKDAHTSLLHQVLTHKQECDAS
jgi:hypothetical protein